MYSHTCTAVKIPMFTSSPDNVQTGLPPWGRQQNKKRPKRVVIYFGRANQIVIPTMPGGMAGPFRLVRFKHAMRVFTNFAHELYQFKSGGRQQNKKRPKWVVIYFGSPNQIRTGVLALKGRCPRPLDDGAKTAADFEFIQSKTPANYNHLCTFCQDINIVIKITGILCK